MSYRSPVGERASLTIMLIASPRASRSNPPAGARAGKIGPIAPCRISLPMARSVASSSGAARAASAPGSVGRFESGATRATSSTVAEGATTPPGINGPTRYSAVAPSDGSTAVTRAWRGGCAPPSSRYASTSLLGGANSSTPLGPAIHGWLVLATSPRRAAAPVAVMKKRATADTSAGVSSPSTAAARVCSNAAVGVAES
mmetsp:Transcript_37378/g.120783  ORF Transcript_37378/g.120783 Transcript_37378/m.120783 type:complete len:200 (+) Transcript_37378:1741-2340(+)